MAYNTLNSTERDNLKLFSYGLDSKAFESLFNGLSIKHFSMMQNELKSFCSYLDKENMEVFITAANK